MDDFEQKHRYLLSLTRALCDESGIGIGVSDKSWGFDHGNRELHYKAEDLLVHGAEYCAGIIVHEIGHIYLSRQILLQATGWDEIYKKVFCNFLEDARVESWMVQKYPGAVRWLSYLRNGLKPTRESLKHPLFIRFAMASRFLCSGEEPFLKIWGEKVIAALKVTCQDRFRYHENVPPLNFRDYALSREQRERFEEEIDHRILPGIIVPDNDSEKLAFLNSRDCLDIVEQEMLPSLLELIRADIQRLAWALKQTRTIASAEQLLETDSEEGIKLLVGKIFSTTEGTTIPESEDLPLGVAEELYQRYLDQRKRIPERPISRTREKAQPVKQPYAAYRKTIQPQVSQLEQNIAETLRKKTRDSQKRGYPWGNRPDLRKVMAFEADPRRYDQLWQRRKLPQRRSVAVMLLVDLSGSMRGEKVLAAAHGAILVIEALTRLAIPFAVHGFQDVVIPFFNFGEELTFEAKNRIADMSLEVSGDRPGGNNNYGYNDDGPCLLESAAALLQRPETDKVQIVISDGLPEGKRSSKQDLVDAISRLEKQGVFLFGVGLGPRTDHVHHYYSNAVANVPVAQLSKELSGLIQKVVV